MIKQAQSLRYSDPERMQHRPHGASTMGTPQSGYRTSTSSQQMPHGQHWSTGPPPQGLRSSTEYQPAATGATDQPFRPTAGYQSSSTGPQPQNQGFPTPETQHPAFRSSVSEPPPLDYYAATMERPNTKGQYEDPTNRRASTGPPPTWQHGPFHPVSSREREENLRIYQDLVGITTPPELDNLKGRVSVRSYMCFSRPSKNRGYYQSIVDEEFKATIWYHSSTWGVNFLLALQISIAAALTALGASASTTHSQTRGLAIAVLGGINTAVATTLAYTKAKGIPMRALVYRNDLRKLLQHIRYTERLFELGIYEGPAAADPAQAAASVKATFDQVQEKVEKQEEDAEMGELAAHPAGGVAGPGSGSKVPSQSTRPPAAPTTRPASGTQTAGRGRGGTRLA